MPSERPPGAVFEAAGWQRRARRLLPAASTANRLRAFMPLKAASPPARSPVSLVCERADGPLAAADHQVGSYDNLGACSPVPPRPADSGRVTPGLSGRSLGSVATPCRADLPSGTVPPAISGGLRRSLANGRYAVPDIAGDPAVAGGNDAGRAHETYIESAISPWTDWSLMSKLTPSLAPARFSELGVPEVLAAALESRGIVTPFPIQAAALPDCLAGRDVCGKAPTGSGKTLAFGLAVLARLSGESRQVRGRRQPTAFVLVPTRELASQIEEVIGSLARVIGARVVSVYGGVGYGKQLAALRAGVDVLVACPGRLTDLLERGSLRLSHVDLVVVDEADRMADMGFLPVVRRLIDQTSSERQTLLFSATLEGAVDKLVRDYQHQPARHDVVETAADRGDVAHHFWRVDSNDRATVTAEMVSSSGPAVVFCRTKRGADRLSDRLSRSGLASAAIHGDRSQSQREKALAAFRAGRLDVLVATDVAARGIHVDAVPLVIHFDPPADATDYVHRSGRTGRAGADGTVVSLIAGEHLAATKRMQRRLGFTGGVSSPDVASLPSLGERPSRRDRPKEAVWRENRSKERPRSGGYATAGGRSRSKEGNPGRARRRNSSYGWAPKEDRSSSRGQARRAS